MLIQENLNKVRDEIAKSCAKANRSVEEVTLIAVTKTMPVQDIQEAKDAGMFYAGENKVQEIRQKYEVFKDEIQWHMIGHLQTNKVKYIIDKVSIIHSVDSIKLATVIDKEAKKHGKIMEILIQVMLVEEDRKFGVSPQELESLLSEISRLENVKVRGLMTVAPYVEDPEENREVFASLKKILVDMNLKNIDNVTMDVLSMGMTNDYKVAIEEGATMVRVGTAIFGKRNYKKG